VIELSEKNKNWWYKPEYRYYYIVAGVLGAIVLFFFFRWLIKFVGGIWVLGIYMILILYAMKPLGKIYRKIKE